MLLTEQQVSEIEQGHYGDGWRLDLCESYRALTAQVAEMKRECLKVSKWCDRVTVVNETLTTQRDAAQKALAELWDAFMVGSSMDFAKSVLSTATIDAALATARKGTDHA